MRKLLIIFALLLLLPMMLNAQNPADQFIPLPTSLVVYDTSTVTADTSAWFTMPVDCLSLTLWINATGEDAGDACSVFVDFCEADTTDSFQLWRGAITKNYTYSDHWFGGRSSAPHGQYPEGFEYLRMRRYVTACTGKVIVRAFLAVEIPVGARRQETTRIFDPFGDSLTSTSATADTSAWFKLPTNIYDMEFMMAARGDDTGDLCSLYFDFAESDTTDTCHIWLNEQREPLAIGSALWYNTIDDYSYADAFQYVRMRRVIATVSTRVTMRAWCFLYLKEE